MNAKRGYVPEDEKNFAPEAIHTMQIASRHVRYLINEGYDLKQASTFVGNHFLLSERQRLAIMRSLATDEQLVINVGGYIGESTRSEIEYAKKAGKAIRYLHP